MFGISKCNTCNKPLGINPFCKNCRLFRINLLEEISGKKIPDKVKKKMLNDGEGE